MQYDEKNIAKGFLLQQLLHCAIIMPNKGLVFEKIIKSIKKAKVLFHHLRYTYYKGGIDMEEEKQPTADADEIGTQDGSVKADHPKGKTSSVLVVAIVLLVAVLVVLVGVLIYLSQKPSERVAEGDAGSSGIVITEDTRDAGQQVNDRVAAGMIAVKMTPVWYFSDGASEGNCYVANSKANDKPLQITVRLADSEEVILDAGPIPVGSCIENFKLDKDLPAGTYDAIVTHTQLDENGDKYNSVQTQISIEIQN